MKLNTLQQDIKYFKVLIESGNKKMIKKCLNTYLPEYNIKILKGLKPIDIARLNELEII